jgi:hypothetical protein
MSIARGLKHLGFVPLEDFVLQDDGNGPYINEWLSDKQKPTVADIDLGYTDWEKEQIAKQDRLASVKSKLEALGLTTEEVQDAFGL